MILFGLLSLVVILSWVVFASSAKKDKEITPLYFFLALLTTGWFIGSCIYMGEKNSDAVGVMIQRQYYQDLITNLSDDASFETVAKIVASAEFINGRILKNRANADNILWGSFYNKKIGEIELIEIPKLYLKNFRKGYGMDGAFW